jgi:hypothetical protein
MDCFAYARNDDASRAGCYAAFACTVLQNSASRSVEPGVATVIELLRGA